MAFCFRDKTHILLSIWQSKTGCSGIRMQCDLSFFSQPHGSFKLNGKWRRTRSYRVQVVAESAADDGLDDAAVAWLWEEQNSVLHQEGNDSQLDSWHLPLASLSILAAQALSNDRLLTAKQEMKKSIKKTVHSSYYLQHAFGFSTAEESIPAKLCMK